MYAFIGGIPEWRHFNYPMAIDDKMQQIQVEKLAPVEFQSLAASGDYYLLDVRPLEFSRDASFVAGSRHCPLVYLDQRHPEIPKDRPLLIADWAMKQSTTAAVYLTTRGYRVAGVLKGGLERWKSEGLPVEQRVQDGRPAPLSSVDAP